LKHLVKGFRAYPGLVAPHAGAWIETPHTAAAYTAAEVAPHAGAWIETFPPCCNPHQYAVAPHAGAWIETFFRSNQYQSSFVAPHAGAWIETDRSRAAWRVRACRPPCGGVD